MYCFSGNDSFGGEKNAFCFENAFFGGKMHLCCFINRAFYVAYGNALFLLRSAFLILKVVKLFFLNHKSVLFRKKPLSGVKKMPFCFG